MNLRIASAKSRAALVVGLLAVVVRVGTTVTLTINGESTCNHTDFAGIGLGGVAVFIALLAGWEAATGLTDHQHQARKDVTWGVTALALLLGAVGLLKGFAVVMSPCG
ncbi:hypothetical protein ABT061_27115 [Streptosporangium sp. NPDC002544]|uniref:hypothetical protein n=1 Tax=Streptosporangium sp. NPDC002544 TaxID=3154538 RepID=UPI0033187462